MTTEEINPCPFLRSVVGPHGSILLRKNEQHASECTTAIKRRDHPSWSRFNCGFRVEAGTPKGHRNDYQDV